MGEKDAKSWSLIKNIPHDCQFKALKNQEYNREGK